MTARIKPAGSDVIQKWDYGALAWIPENNEGQPEVAPKKEVQHSPDHRKISELLARISGLQGEIRTLKSEKSEKES